MMTIPLLPSHDNDFIRKYFLLLFTLFAFHSTITQYHCVVSQQLNNNDNAQQYGTSSSSSSSRSHHRRERVSWCTINALEKRKCSDWAKAIEETNAQNHAESGIEPFDLNLDCVQGADKDQCMAFIDDELADMMLLDPGEIGLAGRYHSLSPIMMERYGPSKSEMGHYSVALVRKRSNIYNLSDLFGKRACFSGVNHMSSWVLPLASLIDLPRFEIADCNNLVKSASYFFGISCAPNALINKFNPTGDNPQKMSILCEQQAARVGAHQEPYTGAFSALKCLADPLSISNHNNYNQASIFNTNSHHQHVSPETRTADIAFLAHTTLFLTEKLNLPREMRAEIPLRSELELLCPQGGRAPLERWQNCHFGFVPAHAVIVSSRMSQEARLSIQKFLKTSVDLFSGPISTLGQDSTLNSGTRLQQQTIGNRFTQQQSPASAFDLNSASNVFHQDPNQSNRWNPSMRQSNHPSRSTYSKTTSDFRLTGDTSLYNYPSLDVLFSSDMTDLVPLHGAMQTFNGYLDSFPVQPASSGQVVAGSHTSQNSSNFRPPNEAYSSLYSLASREQHPKSKDNEIRVQTEYFKKLRRCPVPAAILCVNSEKEFNKCLRMSKAFHAASLKPDLSCKLAQSTLACMQLIKNRDADLVVLDPGDIYLAGSRFGLIPIVMEQIDLYEPRHYAVAIAKKSDTTTDLFTLKTKNTCHSGFLKGSGWIMPMSFLLNNNRIRKYANCDSARSAAEHFQRSCAPGILSSISNTQNVSLSWTIGNMCQLCHGSGRNYCARDASEPFHGDTGAFRCLVEGGGDVAFCKHTAIFANTGGSNRETWARNLIKSDFELLCRDGSRAPVKDFKTCNLGHVPPNAIVTRGDTPFQLIDAYVNLFMYGQQYYGSRYTEEYTFKMFSSSPNNDHDLIFQDATQLLTRVPTSNQTYESYLGHQFLRAIDITFCN